MSQYDHWVHQAEAHAARIRQRKAELRRIIKPNVATLGGDRIDYAADAAIARDQIINDYETLRQRAVALATMYGIGELIKILSPADYVPPTQNTPKRASDIHGY